MAGNVEGEPIVEENMPVGVAKGGDSDFEEEVVARN